MTDFTIVLKKERVRLFCYGLLSVLFFMLFAWSQTAIFLHDLFVHISSYFVKTHSFHVLLLFIFMLYIGVIADKITRESPQWHSKRHQNQPNKLKPRSSGHWVLSSSCCFPSSPSQASVPMAALFGWSRHLAESSATNSELTTRKTNSNDEINF